MGQAIVQDAALAAVLVPDPLISAATLVAPGSAPEDSDLTLGAPTAGEPVWRPELASLAGTHGTAAGALGVRGPDLRLIAAGPQTADLRVRVTRAGLPGGGLEVAVGVRDVDATSAPPVADGWRWHGGSQPHIIEEVAAGVVLDKGINGRRNLAMVEADDGHVVVLTANSSLKARRYDPATLDWSGAAVAVADPAQAMGQDTATPKTRADVCAILRLPSGRLLAGAYVENTDYDGEISTYWSDDHGQSWRSASLGAVDVALAAGRTVTGLELAYDPQTDAVLALLSAAYTDGDDTVPGWVQYASGDLGATLDFVEDWADGDTGSLNAPGHPSVVPDPVGGGLVVLYGVSTGVGAAVRQRRLASPYLPLRQAVEELLVAVATASRPADIVAFADPAGALWVAWTPSTTGVTGLLRSDDGALTWAALATPLLAPGAGAIDRLHACPLRGRRGSGVVWALTDTAETERAPQRMLLVHAGGWQQLLQPRVAGGYPYELRGWSATWLPYGYPTNLGWTAASGPGTLATVGTWGLTLSGAGHSFSQALGGSSLGGAIAHAELTVSGGPVDSRGVHLRLVRGSQAVEARIGPSAVVLHDTHAAADLGSLAVTLGTGRWHLRLALRDARAALYLRAAAGGAWRLVAAGALTVGSPASDLIGWGHGPGGNPSSVWHRVSVCEDAGWGSHTGHTDSPASGTLLAAAPDSLHGAPVPSAAASAAGLALHLPGGTRLTATGGPGVRGETWQVDQADLYGAPHLHTRSPAQTCRLAVDGVEQRIVWEPQGGYPHHPGGVGVGVAVLHTNLRSLLLEGWDGSAWVEVAELDLALSGLAYTRDGDTIRAAVGGTARGQLHPLDLEGATIQLEEGCLRRVARATSGTWAAGQSATATLQLEGLDGTEPTSGTALLWLRSGAAVAFGAVTSFSRWSLRIPAQSTVDGFAELGRVVVGAVLPWGARYSHGRVTTTTPQVSVVELPGLRLGRRLSRPARQVQVQWAEGVPTRGHQTAPDYQAAGGVPLVCAGDLSLVEVLQHTHGEGVEQLVYLPRLERDPAASAVEVVQVRGRDWAILASLTGAPTVEDVDGEELRRGVIRVAGLELVEEPSP